jgi:hypothetical protein
MSTNLNESREDDQNKMDFVYALWRKGEGEGGRGRGILKYQDF